MENWLFWEWLEVCIKSWRIYSRKIQVSIDSFLIFNIFIKNSIFNWVDYVILYRVCGKIQFSIDIFDAIFQDFSLAINDNQKILIRIL